MTSSNDKNLKLSVPQQADDRTSQAAADRAGGAGDSVNRPNALPKIEPEPAEQIKIGAGGKLVVPREDLDVDLDDSADLDLAELQAKKIRKPGRRDWIALSPLSELTTRLLLHKTRPDAIETEYFYIQKDLRGPIRDELKNVRVFVYYCFRAKAFGLWIINITLDNSWYESIAQLLKQPREFFEKSAIRVIPDLKSGCYRIRYKLIPAAVAWPTKSTSELLGEALGPGHIITAPDHEIYNELVEGIELP